MYASDENSKDNNPGDRVYDRVNRHTDTKVEEIKEQLKTLTKEVSLVLCFNKSRFKPALEVD